MNLRENATTTPGPASPNDALARRIVDQLVNLSLLAADDRERCASAIAAGSMRGSEWRAAIEKASGRPE